MNIVQQQSLKKYNTFGIEAFATEFCEVNSITDLVFVLKENQLKKVNKLHMKTLEELEN